MRIVVAVNAPSRHLFPLLVRWKDLGHDVSAVVSSMSGRLGNAETYQQQGIEVRVLRTSATARSSTAELSRSEFAHCAAKSDALVVGGYATRSAITALSIPRRRRPLTVMLAERPDRRSTGMRRACRDLLIRWAISRTDAVWAMSSAGKAAFEGLGAVVPLLAPYPLPEHLPLARCERRGAVNIAVIGRLDQRKDPLAAAAALRNLHEQGFCFDATFYGDGPLRNELSRAVSGLPVRLAGHVSPNEIDSALQHSDILLHPCRYDGWGMAVAEAVVAKVAVVAGKETDAANEFAPLGETVSVAPTSPGSLAAEIISMSRKVITPEGPELFTDMRLKAEKHAGLTAVASRTLEYLSRGAVVP